MAARPIKITITYCAECGYTRQALDLAEALLTALHSNLSSLELIPWHDGAFDVTVAGDLVHSMLRDDGFPDPAAIIRAARERFAAPA